MRDIKRKPAFVPVTVSENLTWDQFATLNVHSPDLPGIQPDAGPTRDYPFKDSFSHVVGYVGAVTEDDLKGNSDPLFQLPGFKIGRRGVERVRDEELRGKPGTSRVEVNAVGRVVRELARQEGTPGDRSVSDHRLRIADFRDGADQGRERGRGGHGQPYGRCAGDGLVTRLRSQ